MLENVYEGLNARSEVYLSKEYFCKMYPTCVSSKLCEFISSLKVLSQPPVPNFDVTPWSQCTMGKMKNGVKSSQLWQIISPWMLNQKFPNFVHSSLNSPQTQKTQTFETKYLTNEEKRKKNLLVVFTQVKSGLKKPLAKRFFSCPEQLNRWLVTFETLITILKIENLNSWQSVWPDN